VEEKSQLIITAMQERIGQLAANYELQIAMLRAELTVLSNQSDDKQKALDSYSDEIQSKLEGM
jgi:phage host-nuclease inhibitor protein Gam